MKKTLLITTLIMVSVVVGGYLSGLKNSSRDDSPARKLYPLVSISPDDRQIAFSYDGAIFTSGMDGSDTKQLTFPKNDYHIGPEFSPDGTKILFISDPKKPDKPSSSIRVIDTNGGDSIQVTEGKEYITWAIFSEDGGKIFFFSADYYGQYSEMYRPGFHDVDLYSVNVDGTDRKQLTDLKAYGMSDLGISADGKELYFTQHHLQSTFYALPLDNTAKKEPLHSGEYADNYRLSPDKKLLVFHDVSEKSRNSSPFLYELFVMDMATKQTKQLTTVRYAISPKFFHHQQKLIFLHGLNWPNQPLQYEVMAINLDGTHPERIHLPFESEKRSRGNGS